MLNTGDVPHRQGLDVGCFVWRTIDGYIVTDTGYGLGLGVGGVLNTGNVSSGL